MLCEYVLAQACERGIETSVKAEGDVPLVMADKDSLRSVFTNLLINSVEATNGEGGRVEIKLSAESADRARS